MFVIWALFFPSFFLVEKRLDLVEFFVKKPSLRKTVAENHLKKFPDFAPIVSKLERKRASLQDLYRTFLAIQRIPAVVDAIRPETDSVPARTVQLIEENFLGPLSRAFAGFKDYQDLIKGHVECTARTGEYRIKPATTPQLKGFFLAFPPPPPLQII